MKNKLKFLDKQIKNIINEELLAENENIKIYNGYEIKSFRDDFGWTYIIKKDNKIVNRASRSWGNSQNAIESAEDVIDKYYTKNELLESVNFDLKKDLVITLHNKLTSDIDEELGKTIIKKIKKINNDIYKIDFIDGFSITATKSDKWRGDWIFDVKGQKYNSWKSNIYDLRRIFLDRYLSIIQQFNVAVKGHDFTFNFSDDFRYYQSGQKNLEHIKDLYRELRDKNKEKAFKIWNTEAPDKFQYTSFEKFDAEFGKKKLGALLKDNLKEYIDKQIHESVDFCKKMERIKNAASNGKRILQGQKVIYKGLEEKHPLMGVMWMNVEYKNMLDDFMDSIENKEIDFEKPISIYKWQPDYGKNRDTIIGGKWKLEFEIK